MSVESSMTDSDWEDIKESEFCDIAEGISSFAVIFEHDKLGLHGFQVKYGSEGATLEPKSFSRKSDDSPNKTAESNEEECPDCGSRDLVATWGFGLRCTECGWEDRDYFVETVENAAEDNLDESENGDTE